MGISLLRIVIALLRVILGQAILGLGLLLGSGLRIVVRFVLGPLLGLLGAKCGNRKDKENQGNGESGENQGKSGSGIDGLRVLLGLAYAEDREERNDQRQGNRGRSDPGDSGNHCFSQSGSSGLVP